MTAAGGRKDHEAQKPRGDPSKGRAAGGAEVNRAEAPRTEARARNCGRIGYAPVWGEPRGWTMSGGRWPSRREQAETMGDKEGRLRAPHRGARVVGMQKF